MSYANERALVLATSSILGNFNIRVSNVAVYNLVVRVGQDVYVEVSHAHTRDMARGGDGLEPYVGRVTGALDGYVEFLDDLGTQWKWLDK